MPFRLVLELTAAAAGMLAAAFAHLQVEKGELPAPVLWLAISLTLAAVTMEAFEFLGLVQTLR
jgi:hypothetical protein